MHPASPQIRSLPNPAPRPTPHWPLHWQVELAQGYRTVAELVADLGLTSAECGVGEGAIAGFPLRVPRGFVGRMRPGDPRDPLLLQVLPTLAEAATVPGYVADPVGDLQSIRVPGLLQKYAGRALLITTGACAIHCRYCFRRAFPYPDQSATGDNLRAAVQAVAADDTLREIILSGGDPLVLSEARLEELLLTLDDVPHLERIRLHTRVPIVLPERVDGTLLALLGRLRKRVVVVVHANHAREFDADVRRALELLARVGGPVLNQSVLLRGVNDTPDALAELSAALFATGVLPYYLHQLDPVAGAAHFVVGDTEARALVTEVARRLPGYLVPRLVRETTGAAAKTLLGPFGTT